MDQEPRIEANEITQAQNVSDWFPDYLYGAIDTPGFIPPLVAKRLRRQFGPGDLAQQIEIVRDSLMVFDEVHQSNLANYFCGFPDSYLELLQDDEHNMAESIAALDSMFKPHNEPDSLLVNDMLPGETVEGYLDRKRSEREYRYAEKRQSEAASSSKTPSSVGKIVALSTVSRVSSLAPRATKIPNMAKAILPDDHPLAWQNDSLCAETDPEAFFPEKGGSTRSAKRICSECEVTEECLVYALSSDEKFGIWGGASERERRKLKAMGIAGPKAVAEYLAKQSNRKQETGASQVFLVEPYQQQGARMRHFVRLINGDNQLEDAYYERPQEMARTAHALLSEMFPKSESFDVEWRRRRLENYFLGKKWNRYQDEFGGHSAYWELLTADLTHFAQAVAKMQDTYNQQHSDIPFSKYYLERWQAADIDGATTTWHIRRPGHKRIPDSTDQYSNKADINEAFA